MAERLYRSRTKKVFGGVAGGLGDYLNIDPVLVRVLFVIITLINGLGLLLYIILWIVVQEEPYQDYYEMGPSTEGKQQNNEAQSSNQTMQPQMKKEGKGAIIAGVILIALGSIFFIDNWFPSFDFKDIFPLAILGVGIWLLVDSLNKRENRNENR